MPADIELSSEVEMLATGCTLQRMQPGRIAGKSDETGVDMGEMIEGERYWSGTWELAPSDRTDEALAAQAEIEAALQGYENLQRTLRIRIGASRGIDRIEFQRTGGIVFDPPVNAELRTAVNGKRFAMAGAVPDSIIVRPGFWFTFQDRLYIYAGQNDINVSRTDIVDCVPPFTNTRNNLNVEFRDPYVIGKFPQVDGTPLTMSGDLAGPWTIPFDEED